MFRPKKPIYLMFHKITEGEPKAKYSMPKRQFIEKLEYLKRNQYQCISIENCNPENANEIYCKVEKSVALTFDDGYESDCTMSLPLLEQYGFKGNFFVTTDWIGKSGYMNSLQIRRLSEQGMSIQSHGKTHSYFDEMTVEKIYEELSRSKKALEDITGRGVTSISVPGGRYNKEMIEVARQLKYSTIYCSIPYFYEYVNGVFLIGRCTMKKNIGERQFERMIQGRMLEKTKAQAKYLCKHLSRKMLGEKLYYLLWKKYNFR